MSAPWPAAETADELFRRFCAGDAVAQSELIAAVLDPLAAHLRWWRPGADEHAYLTAAEDAVLSLIRNPTVYDPAKRTLIGFLKMAAEGDLLNALEKEKRHHQNRGSGASVELVAGGGNTVADELAGDLPSFADPTVAAEIASFTDSERAVFDLMRGGERGTPAFAAALGVRHLSADEQAREAKRVKDRIIKRLKRAGGKT